MLKLPAAGGGLNGQVAEGDDVQLVGGLPALLGGSVAARAPRGSLTSVNGPARHQAGETAPARSLEALDDAALVRAAAAGSRDAFDALVRRHQRAVYQLCYRFAGNHADACDLAQEAFVRAYRGLAAFKGDAAFATWLHRIAVNAALTWSASRRPAAEPVEPERHPDGRQEPADAALLRAERARRVRAAIARLPKKQRATLVLRVYRELPHEEIARILGSSVGAAKANLFHALRHLRALLAEEEA